MTKVYFEGVSKNAIITGAAKGIGFGIANYLAKNGYNLVLIDIANLSTIKLDFEKIYSVNVDIYQADLSNLEIIEELCKNILLSKNNNINVLVNNAGIYLEGLFEPDFHDINKLIKINLLSHFHLTKIISSAMKINKSGYIFNIASRSGKYARYELGAYAISKFALLGFNEALYEEMMTHNIKVTALCPSVVNTDMNRHLAMHVDDKIEINDIINTVDFLLRLGKNAYVKDIVIDCKESFVEKKGKK